MRCSENNNDNNSQNIADSRQSNYTCTGTAHNAPAHPAHAHVQGHVWARGGGEECGRLSGGTEASLLVRLRVGAGGRCRRWSRRGTERR